MREPSFDTLAVWSALRQYFLAHGWNDASEDMASETLIKLLRADANGKTITRAYYYTAARTITIDHARTAKMQEGKVPRLAVDDSAEDRYDLEEAPDLTGEERIVWQWRADGYTAKEIAQMLGVSRRMIRRTMQQVRLRLQEQRV
jgi:RNA polymerase sigma factor (sigma-70 family)